MGMNPRLLRPKASGFNPRSISGLALWLDAADSSSLYTTDAGPVTAVSAPTEISGCVGWWDASDSASITASGGLVSQWNDKSGQGNHATASGTARPTATASGLNGLQVLTFNGSSTAMGITGTSRTNETLFVVGRANTAATGTVKANYFLSDSSSGFGLAAVLKSDGASGGVEINLGGFTTGTTRASFVVATGQPYGPGLLSAVRSAASGGTLLNAGASQATCTTSNAFAVSRIGSVGAFFLDGYIAEVIIFNTALSTTDRARVEAYLAAKWGISGVHVPATATSAPVGYWGDKSGNNRHATQATGASRPTHSTAALAGRNVLTATDVNRSMKTPAFPVGLPQTVFVVASVPATGNHGIFQRGAINDIHSLWQNAGTFRARRGSSFDATATATAGYHVFTCEYTMTLSRLFVEGALGTDNDANATGLNAAATSPARTLALFNLDGSIGMTGGIAEVLYYDGSLSTFTRQRIERYLAAKWGITLAPQVANADAQDWVNRVYANGGTVSSATANAVNTFCNDIDSAGIRDRFFRLNLFCGTGLAACLVPLYRGTSLAGTQYGNATDTNQNFVSGDYSESGGLASSAASTKALSTGVMPMESGSPLFNYGHYFAHVIALPTARSSVMGVRKDPAPSNRHAFQLDSTGQFWGDWCHVNRFNGSASGVSAGKTIIMQAAQVANATQVYASGLLTLTGAIGTFTGTASQGAAIFAARGDFGSGFITSDFSTMSMGAYSIGLDFTAAQALAYHTAYAALATALGRTIA